MAASFEDTEPSILHRIAIGLCLGVIAVLRADPGWRDLVARVHGDLVAAGDTDYGSTASDLDAWPLALVEGRYPAARDDWLAGPTRATPSQPFALPWRALEAALAGCAASARRSPGGSIRLPRPGRAQRQAIDADRSPALRGRGCAALAGGRRALGRGVDGLVCPGDAGRGPCRDPQDRPARPRDRRRAGCRPGRRPFRCWLGAAAGTGDDGVDDAGATAAPTRDAEVAEPA